MPAIQATQVHGPLCGGWIGEVNLKEATLHQYGEFWISSLEFVILVVHASGTGGINPEKLL